MIGKFRHRITLQEATVTRGDRGAEELTWTDIDVLYADIRTVGGQEQVLASQIEVATLLHTITIRYRFGIVPKMRVVWGERVFSIEAIIEPDNRMRTLLLSCRELFGDAEVA